MKHSIKAWMAATRDGELLCIGNRNKGYSYHLGALHTNGLHEFISKWTREEIREDCRIWNEEVRRNAWSKTARLNTVKPVRVTITIEAVK